MAEALAKVKRELGRNAVIVNTRSVKESKWLGLRSQPRVEITATGEVEGLRIASRRATLPSRSGLTTNAQSSAEGSAMPAVDNPTLAGTWPRAMRQEMERIRSLVEDVLVETRRPPQACALPAHLRDLYTDLIRQEVSEKAALGLIEQLRNELSNQQLQDPQRVRRHLAAQIARMIPAAEPAMPTPAGSPRVIALIGPTGVGKTTTIAKLAAQAKLREDRSVALITIDTYRIAAVDQLKTYAQIIDVPLSVVLTPDELAAAVDEHRDADLILIDTAGRSQCDTIRLNELKRYLGAIRTDEVHLVLSSTSTRSHLLRTAQAFAPLGVNRVILTKLDEAVGLGVVLDVMHQVGQRLSYLTTGQNVPDDIEVFDAPRFARRVLAGGADGSPGSDALTVSLANPEAGP